MKELVSTILLLLGSFGMAQDYYLDAVQVAEKLQSIKELSMEVKVSLYNSGDQPFQTYKASMCKEGEKYYSKYASTTIISVGKKTIMVDDEKKEITLLTGPRLKDAYSLDEALNQLKEGIDSVRYVGQKGNVRTYELYSKKTLFEKSVVSFNTSNYTITRIEYHYPDDGEAFEYGMQKAVVDYQNISYEVERKEVFNTRKILVKKNGEYQPTEQYKHYTLSL